DPAVLLFAMALSVAAGLVFGLLPVIRYATPHVTSALRAGGRTLSQSREAHRVRNSLVILQTALAVVLLIGSGLMIPTFRELRKVKPGFRDAAPLQTLRIYIPDAQVKDHEPLLRMQQEMLRKISEVPGVSAAAFSNSVPADNNNSKDLLYAEDRVYREGEIP